jgi:hypothetical protein
MSSEMFDDFLVDEVIDEKFVIFEKLFHEIKLAWFFISNNIVENELKPLRNVHLEEDVVSDELIDNFIKSIVKFNELVALVMLIRENVFLQVHLHEIEKFEEQLADTEIFADHLTFVDWEDYIAK